MLAAAAHLQRVTEFLEAFTTGEAEHEVPPTRNSAHIPLSRASKFRSANRLGSPLPHLYRDRARPCHICAGTGLIASTSAPNLG
jgi:hypothetical protein